MDQRTYQWSSSYIEVQVLPKDASYHAHKSDAHCHDGDQLKHTNTYGIDSFQMLLPQCRHNTTLYGHKHLKENHEQKNVLGCQMQEWVELQGTRVNSTILFLR